MELYNATQFSRNKMSVENTECHDWNIVHNVITSDLSNLDI